MQRDDGKYGEGSACERKGSKIEILSRWRLCGKSLVCGQARAESPVSPQPRATPWVPCPHSLRPVRAKVKVNRSPTLLPLQGVGVYTLIPRALPWAENWLPFQGAPFRALFVYHVRMLIAIRADLQSLSAPL